MYLDVAQQQHSRMVVVVDVEIDSDTLLHVVNEKVMDDVVIFDRI